MGVSASGVNANGDGALFSHTRYQVIITAKDAESGQKSGANQGIVTALLRDAACFKAQPLWGPEIATKTMIILVLSTVYRIRTE